MRAYTTCPKCGHALLEVPSSWSWIEENLYKSCQNVFKDPEYSKLMAERLINHMREQLKDPITSREYGQKTETTKVKNELKC